MTGGGCIPLRCLWYLPLTFEFRDMNDSENVHLQPYAPDTMSATPDGDARAEEIDRESPADATEDRGGAATVHERRINDFIDWYTELPESVIAGMGVEQRLRLGHFFGEQFARTRVVVEQLKTTPRSEEFARGPGIHRKIKVMSPYIRRYLKREFYHLQAGYRIREGRGEFELNEAWVDEFLARSHWYLKEYVVKDESLETQACCLIDANVLTPRLEEVLDGLLRIDRVMASYRRDSESQHIKPWLGSLLTEPLGWIKDVSVREAPSSRYAVLTRTAHIQRQRSVALVSTNRSDAARPDDPADDRLDQQAAASPPPLASDVRVTVRRRRSLGIGATTPD